MLLSKYYQIVHSAKCNTGTDECNTKTIGGGVIRADVVLYMVVMESAS